jgi:hypothetical protein
MYVDEDGEECYPAEDDGPPPPRSWVKIFDEYVKESKRKIHTEKMCPCCNKGFYYKEDGDCEYSYTVLCTVCNLGCITGWKDTTPGYRMSDSKPCCFCEKNKSY